MKRNQAIVLAEAIISSQAKVAIKFHKGSVQPVWVVRIGKEFAITDFDGMKAARNKHKNFEVIHVAI